MRSPREFFLISFAISGLVLSIFVGCIVSPDGVDSGKVKPGPVNPSPVAAAAQESLANYGRSMADNFESVAHRLESGELVEAADANAELAKLNKASRTDAFSQIDREFQTRIGGGQWEPAEAAKVFREAAKGLRK